MGDQILDSSGKSSGFWVKSYYIANTLLIVIITKSVLITRHWVHPIWWGYFGSIIISVIFQILVENSNSFLKSMGITATFTYVEAGTYARIHTYLSFYLTIMIATTIALLPDFVLTM